jgi:hypothetical protein
MRAIFLLLVLVITGCSSSRYPNWEYVRIEYSVPNDSCEYKIQEACSHVGARCYNWYKQRATVFEANTVVITQADKDVSGSSRAVVYQGSGSSRSDINTNLTALADYYYCETDKSFNKKRQSDG